VQKKWAKLGLISYTPQFLLIPHTAAHSQTIKSPDGVPNSLKCGRQWVVFVIHYQVATSPSLSDIHYTMPPKTNPKINSAYLSLSRSSLSEPIQISLAHMWSSQTINNNNKFPNGIGGCSKYGMIFCKVHDIEGIVSSHFFPPPHLASPHFYNSSPLTSFSLIVRTVNYPLFARLKMYAKPKGQPTAPMVEVNK
jgi:hypothetical protein